MEKIYLTTTFKLCDNNGYLGTQLSNFFIQNGFEPVERPEHADAIVISTCGFDQERENFSISVVDGYICKFAKDKKIIINLLIIFYYVVSICQLKRSKFLFRNIPKLCFSVESCNLNIS